MGNMSFIARIPAALLLLWLSISLARQIIEDIKTGDTQWSQEQPIDFVNKEKHPLLFWFAIAGKVLFSCGLFYGFIYVLWLL